ncbi:MAG: hypothetical protein R2849_12225 [Thermomicrobiales bacterium]
MSEPRSTSEIVSTLSSAARSPISATASAEPLGQLVSEPDRDRRF